ncbi:MAG TPA: hypothetical protein VF095_01165 [Bacillota bacterium]
MFNLIESTELESRARPNMKGDRNVIVHHQFIRPSKKACQKKHYILVEQIHLLQM